MMDRHPVRAVLLLIALLFISACSGTAPLPTVPPAQYTLAEPAALPAALRIPLTERRGYLFVNGAVNGHLAGPMLMDTGSTLNIVDRGLVNRLGLEQIGQGRAVGIAGTQAFTRHRVDALVVGGLDLGVDQTASMSMQPLTRGLGSSVGGIVGSASLLPHPFTIDYARRELTVYRRDAFSPPVDQFETRLYSYNGLPAVRARLANGREVLLILDTGADNAVSLPIELASWHGILATQASGGGVARGVGGEIRTVRGWLDSLVLFGLNLGDVPVTFEPQPAMQQRGDIPVGHIGGQLLKDFRLTFDAQNSRLWASFAQTPDP